MPLQKQVIDIPIVGGVDTGSEDHVQARLEVLENGVYRKRGGIAKRFGTRKRGNADDPAANDPLVFPPIPLVRSLGAYDGESILVTHGSIYTFSEEVNAAEGGLRIWRDNAPEAVATYDVITSQVQQFTLPDVAEGGGFTVYVYTADPLSFDSVSVLSSVRDANGAVLGDVIPITTNPTATTPKVVFVPASPTSYFMCTFRVNVNNTVWVSFLSVDTLSTAGLAQWTLPMQITGLTDIALPVLIDSTSVVGAGFVVASRAAPSGGVHVIRVTHDWVLNTTAFAVADSSIVADTVTAVAASASNNGNVNVAFAYDNADANIAWFQWLPDLSGEIVANTTTIVGGGGAGSNPITVLSIGSHSLTPSAEWALAYSFEDITTGSMLVGATGVGSGARTQVGSFRLIAKVWHELGRYYAVIQQIGIRGGVFVVQIVPNTNFRPIATLLPRASDWKVWPTVNTNGDPIGGEVSSTIRLAEGRYLFSLHSAVSEKGNIFAATIEMNTPRMFAEANNVLLVSGGVPSSFDGSSLAEAGFLLVPDPPVAVNLGAAASGLGTGSYQYALVREWYDAKANLHRSSPAFGVAVAVAAGDQVRIQWSNLGLTLMDDDIQNEASRIANVIFRTNSLGTSFRRLTQDVPFPPFINDPSNPVVVTYVDTASDASIADNEPLYTGAPEPNQTALSNVNPPSSKVVHVHKNRFWLAGTDDDAIWYSKTLVEFEGPAFSAGLTLPRFAGGRVVALGTLDDLLVVFKAGSIYIIQGEGANDNGQGATLTEPRRIASDTGCIEPRSVVLTPEGIMFLSLRGIYLLDRALAVKFVGDPVSEYTQEAGAAITSAVLVPDQNQVRFTLMRATVGGSITLVWDYLAGSWSTFRYHDVFSGDYRGAASACMVGDAYRWITAEGQEYEEDKTTFRDYGEAWVPLHVETAWIKLAGSLQGYQRVWRTGILAEWKAPHIVILGLRTDYNVDAFSEQTESFTLYDTAPLGNVEQLELHPVVQRCSSIRVSFRDDALDATNGDSAVLTAITLEYGVLQGKSRAINAVQKG